ISEDLQLHIRERTHGERDLLANQSLDQGLVFSAAHAVVDARDAEEVESLRDVRRRAFLAGVRDRQQTPLSCPPADRLELRRRIAQLRRVESDRNEEMPERERLLERRHRVVRAEMAHEVEDEAPRDTPLPLRILERAGDAVHHYAERNAAIGVRLRV